MKFFLLITVLLTVSIDSYATQNSSTQKLDSVQEEISHLNQDIKAKKTDRKTLYNQLKQQSKKISAANNQLITLKAKIVEQQKKTKAIRSKLGINQTQQQQQFDQLYNQIRQAFMNDQPSYLELLLNQEDVATISRNSTYYQYFNEARQQQISALSEQLKQLNDHQKSALLAEQSLQNLLNQQQQQQAQLKQQQQQHKITLGQLNTVINSQSNKLKTLLEEKQALQALLDKLAKQPSPPPPTKKPPSTTTTENPSNIPVQPHQPFSRLKGKLIWPTNGKLLALYGSSRGIGSLRWQGVVIDSSKNHNIHAVASGRVIFSDWMRGFGLLIIIDNGHKYMTLYGNNDTLLKHVGDNIKAGEVIATSSGQNGMQGISGLYFELRHRGKPINPERWFRKK